ncbi:MAG: MFS transporter [Candidatus Brocadiia bacterium]
MQVAASLKGLFHSHETGEKAIVADRSFRRFAISFTLDGAAYGLFFYVAFSLAKGFAAPPLLIALAGMCIPVGLLLAYPVGYFFVGRNKRPLYLLAAGLAVISALGFALFPSASALSLSIPVLGTFTLPSGWTFLLWMFLFGIGEAVKFPARYSSFQTNFSYRERSKLIGSLYIFYSVANIAIMFLAGYLLDRHFELYRIIFPSAMILSIIGDLVYASVPYVPPPSGSPPTPFSLKTIHKPFAHIVEMARSERHFMGFELAFFLYGIGYMIMAAILPLIYSTKLGARYEQFGITGVIMSSVMLISPFIGRWSDRIAPTKLAAVAFAANALFPVWLIFCHSPQQAYLAHIWFAAACACDIMAWSIGPIFFSGKHDASKYVGVNATLTGARALIAFTGAGIIQQSVTSFTPILIVASAFFLAGFAAMVIVHRSARRKNKYDTTRSGRFFFVD